MSSKIQWTAEQDAAINLSGGSITVSAAAGSGKTAVLVQRVLRLLSDEKTPVPPERLLIVTFTRAAASEMKIKIKTALRELAKENKAAQAALLNLDQAQISTMDSFCAKLIRDNFELAGVSPDFRMLDGPENESLCDTAMDRALELSYLEDQNFHATADYFLRDRDDRALVNAIRSLYDYAESYPNPSLWLQSVLASFQSDADPFQTRWGNYLLRFLSDSFDYLSEMLSRAIEIAESSDFVAQQYAPALYADLNRFEEIRYLLKNRNDWDTVREKITAAKKLTALRAKPGINNFSQAIAVKNIRSDIKKTIESCAKALCCSSAEFQEDMAVQLPILSSLIGAVTRYSDILLDLKKQRNKYYFSDILHFSISLLTLPDGTPTALAQKMSSFYEEVLIDEYQDTTRAQDALFSAVSNQGNKLFVVGDVKQSIYGFRLATPEIFLEKCDRSFPYEKNTFPAKIILGKNFRSRAGILDFVNYVFSRIMTRQTGDIDYKEDQYLYYGGSDAGAMSDVDILLGENESDPLTCEFRHIAEYINEKIYSRQTIPYKGETREIQYSDFCILLRSVKDTAEKAAKILYDAGIPVIYEKQLDTFSAPEIMMFFSLLTAIDNPLCDVELIAVMTSPIFGFIPDELAQLRSCSQGPFYQCVVEAAQKGNQELAEKCNDFLLQMKTYRDVSQSGTMADFMRFLLEETGFASMIAAMPNGAARFENLNNFIQYAEMYDQGNAIGFPGFLRYLEHIRSTKSEQSYTQSYGNVGNAVQILSIHKSKGLEYPFVILANTTKKFNAIDKYGFVLTDADFGICFKRQDRNSFKRYETLPYITAQLAKQKQIISEEMRILYVALTRASYRLIVSGCTKKLESSLKSIGARLPAAGNPSIFAISQCSSNMEFLLTALLAHPDLRQLREMAACETEEQPSACHIGLFLYHDDESCQQTVPAEAAPAQQEKQAGSIDPKTYETVTEQIEFQYPYSYLQNIPAKLTATEYSEQNTKDFSQTIFPAPSFAKTQSLGGVSRGVAYHKFLQHCDFAAAKQNIAAEIDRLVGLNLLSENEAGLLSVQLLGAFFSSDVCTDILQADQVYREFPFRFLLPADELYAVPSKEPVLIQGVIDLVYIHDGKAFVIDYKTDANADDAALAEKYQPQLKIYKKAMEKILRIPVSQTILFSLSAGKKIILHTNAAS